MSLEIVLLDLSTKTSGLHWLELLRINNHIAFQAEWDRDKNVRGLVILGLRFI